MEPTEIQEFSDRFKEAGESAKPLTGISLAISILAVLVATVTVLGHRTHTEAVLSQGRATDQWNLYQAKKIRSDATGIGIDLLTLQPGSGSPERAQRLVEYRARITRWQEELAEEQNHAREFEAEVAVAEKRAGRFDLGEALLQISVVLCSITLLTRRPLFFRLGIAIGLAGIVIAATAFAK